MSRRLLPSRSSDAPVGQAPHLVVKRGHRGRYRFVLIQDEERIGGEVRVDAAAGARDCSRLLALARIASLAETLLAGVTIHPAVGRDVQAEGAGVPSDISQTDVQLKSRADRGDHRGPV